jgi:adenine nucleotide transporter 17
MAKVRIQARSADVDDHSVRGKSSKVGALEILRRVWEREGFLAWYQVRRFLPPFDEPTDICLKGMQAQITKAVLSQALLFMSKEQFEQWALRMIAISARFS